MATKKTESEVVAIDIAQAQETIEKVLKELAIDGTCEVMEKDEMLDVLLDTPDSGMVIGYHGEVLESLQLILSLVVSRQIGRFVRVSVEVGDYKKNRTAYLENLATKIKEQVIAEQQEQSIASLKSWERRIIHLFLQDDPDVTAESFGEGKERTLVVRPKNQ